MGHSNAIAAAYNRCSSQHTFQMHHHHLYRVARQPGIMGIETTRDGVRHDVTWSTHMQSIEGVSPFVVHLQ